MKKPNLLKHLANLIGRCFKRAPKKQAIPEEVTAQEDKAMSNRECALTQWQFIDWVNNWGSWTYSIALKRNTYDLSQMTINHLILFNNFIEVLTKVSKNNKKKLFNV
jgi:hypothetical protein